MPLSSRQWAAFCLSSAKSLNSDADKQELTTTSKSILQLLLQAREADGKNSLNDQELKDELKTFLLDGQETTSTWWLGTICPVQAPGHAQISS